MKTKTAATLPSEKTVAERGLRVVAIDLDPTGGLSNALEKSKRTVTIADVLQSNGVIHVINKVLLP